MTFNNKTMQNVSSYETPSVTTLEVLSEGVLCGSFDSDNNTEIFDREDMEEQTRFAFIHFPARSTDFFHLAIKNRFAFSRNI